MQHKQIFIVKEHLRNAFVNEPIHQNSETRLTTWCCVDQGQSKIDVTFNKNSFEAHETCQATIKVNNAQCNLNMREVRIALEQELKLDYKEFWNDRKLNQLFTVHYSWTQGVGPRNPNTEERVLNLDLNAIKYVVNEYKNKHGQ